jgi:[ribosomal protein S5]-alanine N-acetyltransferase
VPELQLLREDHAPAVLAFELANRDYFASFISDRGDEYFDNFADHHSTLIAEQDSGIGAYYVLVDEDGSVLGRFNLFFTGEDSGNLGYRVAEGAAGKGLATENAREMCRLAATEHGLRILNASTTDTNIASQKVLTKSGFTLVGPADPSDVGGKSGWTYRRNLTADIA